MTEMAYSDKDPVKITKIEHNHHKFMRQRILDINKEYTKLFSLYLNLPHENQETFSLFSYLKSS